MLRFYLNLYIDFGYQRYETPKAQGNDLRPESNNKVQSLLYEYRPWTQEDVHNLLGFDLFSSVIFKIIN
jgi:hypothetical protein